jgi:Uma2 family endonuclease
VTASFSPTESKEIFYPSSDGEPVAETYDHLYALLTTLAVLTQYLKGRQATVLANQFLYYSQGFPSLRVAPDVMVILGVTPGGRDNYKIWEEGEVPAVIFEITSQGTKGQDLGFKKTLYEQLQVREYWLFDPKGEWIESQLKGYKLQGEIYQPIPDDKSEVLNLRLESAGKIINFYRQDTGEKLLIPDELAASLQQETEARIIAEQRAEELSLELEQEKQRGEKLARRLRELNIDPDQL